MVKPSHRPHHLGLVLSLHTVLHCVPQSLVPQRLSFRKDLRSISLQHICTFIVYISLYSYPCQVLTRLFPSHSLYFILWSRYEDKTTRGRARLLEVAFG